MAISFVGLSDFVNKFQLEVVYKDKDYNKVCIITPATNRPGLSLVGFYDFFDERRLQIIGQMEWKYLSLMSGEERLVCFRNLFAKHIPAVIYTRNQEVFPECMKAAAEYNGNILRTTAITNAFITEITNYLSEKLAPKITRHGVMVEIYGEGVFMIADSGLGKSETALELIKRGHRLIADDAVEITKRNDTTLIGEAPAIIQYYIELRGIGIIDVRQLYGMSAVKDNQTIDLIVRLENWDKSKALTYDRMGVDDTYEEILGVQIPSVTIPVSAGRNIAVILETAAMNNRLKRMGHNSSKEFEDRINEHFAKQMDMIEKDPRPSSLAE